MRYVEYGKTGKVSVVGFGCFSDIDYACKISDENQVYSDENIENIKNKCLKSD